MAKFYTPNHFYRAINDWSPNSNEPNRRSRYDIYEFNSKEELIIKSFTKILQFGEFKKLVKTNKLFDKFQIVSHQIKNDDQFESLDFKSLDDKIVLKFERRRMLNKSTATARGGKQSYNNRIKKIDQQLEIEVKDELIAKKRKLTEAKRSYDGKNRLKKLLFDLESVNPISLSCKFILNY